RHQTLRSRRRLRRIVPGHSRRTSPIAATAHPQSGLRQERTADAIDRCAATWGSPAQRYTADEEWNGLRAQWLAGPPLQAQANQPSAIQKAKGVLSSGP